MDRQFGFEKGFRILRSLYSDRYFQPVAEVAKDTTVYIRPERGDPLQRSRLIVEDAAKAKW